MLRLFTFLTLILFAALAANDMFPEIATTSSQHPAIINERSGEQCGFDGNPDLHGLGIRLGVYLQWLSSLMATRLKPRQISLELLKAHNTFLLAIFVAVMVLTARPHSTHAAEVLVLLYMYFGGSMVIINGVFPQTPSGPASLLITEAASPLIPVAVTNLLLAAHESV